jgi:membrane protein
MDVRAFLGRILERPRVVFVRAIFDVYGHAAGGLLANGLAFSALFAAIPTVLLVLGLTGWMAAGDASVQLRLSDWLVRAFPPMAELIRGAMDAVTDGAAFVSLVGVVGMVWTVSQLVGAVDTAFARIFSEDPERDPLLRTLRGFLVVGLLTTTVVGLLVALGLVAALDVLAGTQGSLARGAVDVLGSPPFLLAATSVAVAIGYRTLPPRQPSWRAIVLPAVLVGVILAILSQAFAFLVPRLVGVAELAGPLASGFVTLAWLSFSFQALLLGAAWVRVRSAALERAAPPAEPGGGGE